MVTSGNTRPPKPDRFITLSTGGGIAYRFNDPVGSPAFLNMNGRYVLYGTGRELALAPMDVNGIAVVALSVGDEITLAAEGTDVSFTVTITTLLTHRENGPDFFWADAIDTDLLRSGTAILFTVGPPPVLTKVGAERRDFYARDTLQQVGGYAQNVALSRFIIRAGVEVGVGQTFIDDEGSLRQIQGIGKIGRGWLEILGSTSAEGDNHA